MATQFVVAALIGIGATLLMDLWNLILKRAFNIPSLNYCLLGRWLRLIPRGMFRHASIAAAPPQSLECAAGWVAHYTIGVVLALVFVALVAPGWLSRPTLLPAVLYGMVTVVFPFFILQPALGFGIASSKAPRPSSARLKSMGTHTVFGVGLYVSALGLAGAPGVRPDCANALLAVYPSPGNELDAVVFRQQCEGTTRMSEHLSILPAGADLPAGDGNVFIAETADGRSGLPEMQFAWQGRNRLVVNHDAGARFIRKRDKEAAVIVEYLAAAQPQ
jgi:hypothetical protein